MSRINFIAVNFNNSHYTAKLLDSLRLQDGMGKEFAMDCVIVDNSTNSDQAVQCQELSAQCPWSSYIRSGENLGYFGGLNTGLAVEGVRDADFVIICNNDLEFEPQFCAELTRRQYDEKVFAVCPDVITADGYHQNPHVLKRINWFRRFQFDLYFSHYYVARLLLMILRVVRTSPSSPPQPQHGCETHLGVGACYVLTAQFLRRFSQLNSPSFLYGEESYISDQIHTAGGILWYDVALRVHHKECAATSTMRERTAYDFARAGYPDYRRIEKRWNRRARTKIAK